MNQDNGFNNADELRTGGADENADRAVPPSVVHLVIFALISAVAALFMPELGLLSMTVISACVIFILSADASIPIQLVSALGILLAFFRCGIYGVTASSAIWFASAIAGIRLKSGKTFQQALMPYVFVTFTATVAAGAVIMHRDGITTAHINDAVKNMIHDMMAAAIEAAGDSVPLETAYLLTEQYEAMAAVAATFIPAVIGITVSLMGIVSLRIAGLLHNISGSTVYAMWQRIALVDRPFAAVWLLSILLAVIDPTGIVGACASNVMLILLFPAVAAGLSECRFMIIRHRLSGRRGIPFFVVLLFFSFIIMSPFVGLIVLALMGTSSAFFKKRIIVVK